MFCFRPDNLGSLVASRCQELRWKKSWHWLSCWTLVFVSACLGLGGIEIQQRNYQSLLWNPSKSNIWGPKSAPLKRKIIFHTSIFWFHVSFRGSGCRCKMIWDDFWIMLAFTKVWEPSDNQGGKLWVSCFLEIHRFSDFSVIAVRIYIYIQLHM